MRSTRGPARAKSPAQVEWETFRGLVARLANHSINSLFDLSIKGPGRRRHWAFYLFVAVICAGFLLHSLFYLNPILALPRQPETAGNLFFLVVTVVRLILVFVLPPMIALNLTSDYLADVFELPEAATAREFLGGLALAGNERIVHIRGGAIASEDEKSPVVLIGGPGRVQVELDSAALFEKPDGRPHVIGPTTGGSRNSGRSESSGGPYWEQQHTAVLEGFERVRRPIINLRDQFIGNPSGEPMTIVGRSLDGITVSAADVRALFSIRRSPFADGGAPDKEKPYPFVEESVEELIYRQSVRVLSEGPHPSEVPPPWTSTMQALVRADITQFMNQNNLTDYLASFGAPEMEMAEFREDTLLVQSHQFSPDEPPAAAPGLPKGRFHPRTELSDRFKRFTDGFIHKAHERGLELHWIGVGTWKIADEIAGEIINGRHIEAWRISRENAARSNPQAIRTLTENAMLDEKLRLIQNVPLAAHHNNLYNNLYNNQAAGEKILKTFLMDYWEQLGEALEACYNDPGTDLPELRELEQAVQRMEAMLGVDRRHHVVGDSRMSKLRRERAAPSDEDTPPAPSTGVEARLYRTLLRRFEDHRIVERMIDHEENRHPGLNREQLMRRILNRWERYSAKP